MKIHRISLSSEGYARLAYISALEQISPKDWIEQRIKDAWSHRDEKAKNPIIQLDDKPKRGAVAVADIPQKRKRLADNPDALQQLKALWAEGMRNGTEIAKRINYPKATVAEHIKKLKEKGELAY